MSKKKNHATWFNKGKHKEVAALEGGACLTGTCKGSLRQKELLVPVASGEGIEGFENRDWTNKDPKWRSVRSEVLGEREDRKRNKASQQRSSRRLPTGPRRRRLYPGGYAFQIALPENKGDWYVGGPLAEKSLRKASGRGYVPKGRNFEHMLWPYWNNAHHLIPKGTLNSLLNDKKEIPDWRARKLIRSALLLAKYNVNHFKNVMLLPMDKEVGIVLRLPRHLVLADETTIVEKKAKFDHIGYNTNVATALKKVIADYKAACDRELAKSCIEPDFSLSKAKLERLSKSCYDTIISFGQTSGGRAISEMPQI